MKLIAGLGNPGPRYAESRHNIGFMAVDELARRWRIDLSRYDRDFEALIGDGMASGQRVLLLKPLTYMNLSGRSVNAVCRFYKLELADLLVICDDLDLPPGRLRLRARGSSGGQRGLADVIRHLGSDEFARLRVGIGKVHKLATVEHVLSRPDVEEREVLADAVSRAAQAAECWLAGGIDEAMNRFNRKE